MSTIATLRRRIAVQRAQTARRRQIEREIATFVSPSDRLELEAILERYTGPDADEIRALLARQTLAGIR